MYQVEALLRYGANVNIRATTSCDDRRDDDDDELPSPPWQAAATAASPILSCAAKNGVPGIVSALLRAGLNPNERDRDGWAPIHDGKSEVKICCIFLTRNQSPYNLKI